MRLSTLRRFLSTAVFALFATTAAPVSAIQVSVDLQSSFGTEGVPFSGVEAAAAAVNPAFGAANIWNHLGTTGFNVTNPSFSGLVANDGTPTGVSFAVTGSTSAFGFNKTDKLRTDFFLWNQSGRADSQTILWTIAGLTPSTEYAFYAYGSKANGIRNFELRVDTDGDGALLDETFQLVGSAASDQSLANDAYFASVFTDGLGRITGSGVGIGSAEANWSGFQLVQLTAAVAAVPEPATATLGVLSVAGLMMRRRRMA